MTNLANPAKYREAALRQYTLDRLASRVARVESGCLEWQGTITDRGYGVIANYGATLSAHRLAYWVAFGEIPGDLVVDPHLLQPPLRRAGASAAVESDGKCPAPIFGTQRYVRPWSPADAREHLRVGEAQRASPSPLPDVQARAKPKDAERSPPPLAR